MGTGDDDEPEVWMLAAKRTNAMRLLAIGVALLVGGGIWAGMYWGHAVADGRPITYVRVVSVLVLAIGAGMTIAGAVLRVRARPTSNLPRAEIRSKSDR